MNNDLRGKVAKCSKGIVGVISGRKELSWGLAWVGHYWEEPDKEWSSRNPEVLADDVASYRLQIATEVDLRKAYKELEQKMLKNCVEVAEQYRKAKAIADDVCPCETE